MAQWGHIFSQHGKDDVSGTARTRPRGPHTQVQNIGGHQQGHGGHAGARPISQRLDNIVRDQLEHDKDRGHQDRVDPIRARKLD